MSSRNYQGRWQKSWAKSILLTLIKLYQYSFSSIIGGHCRYIPSCSEFSYEAIARFGCIKGIILTILRISSCQPWSKKEIYDPVPPNFLSYIKKTKQHKT